MTARRLKFDIRQMGRAITIVLGALAALNLVFYLLVTRPRVQEYTSLQQGSGPQQEALRARRADVEASEAYLAALVKAQNDLATLHGEVLSTRKKRLVEVQLELTALAEQFNIDVESVNFESKLMAEEELDKLVMTVPLEGGYANLRKFLQAVEASSKFLVVERVALGEGKRGGSMLELSITLATYFDAPEELKKQKERERRSRGDGAARRS